MNSDPQISILAPDFRSPSLGAAVRLRELLSPITVEIIGPDFGGGICSMYRDAGPFVTVPTRNLYRWPEFAWESRKLDRAVKGRLVIAMKAYMNTVSVALRLQRKGRVRAAVFLDEWDGAVLSGLCAGQKLNRFLHHMHHPLEDVYYPWVERQISRASLVLSTTTFLQNRFGGEVIAMGVDTERFKPQDKEAVLSLKQELGLDQYHCIVFGGVVRPHKGVEEILDAVVCTGRDDIRVLIVGPVTEHVNNLMKTPRYAHLLQVAGVAMDDPGDVNRKVSAAMPLYLDLADLILLPLQNDPLAQSQMPIKIFEAMAMGKPVVATEVADLPRILDGCGMIVPPGDSAALAGAICTILDDPDHARDMGAKARTACIERYSRTVAGEQLRDLIQPLVDSE